MSSAPRLHGLLFRAIPNAWRQCGKVQTSSIVITKTTSQLALHHLVIIATSTQCIAGPSFPGVIFDMDIVTRPCLFNEHMIWLVSTAGTYMKSGCRHVASTVKTCWLKEQNTLILRVVRGAACNPTTLHNDLSVSRNDHGSGRYPSW